MESTVEIMDSPGSAGYSPAMTEQDDLILFRTRSTNATPPNGAEGSGMPQPSNLLPPDPAEGGKPRQFDALGFSDGFLAFRRTVPFTGRVITRPTMGVHPAVGEVGFSTRSQRLRNGVAALGTDYTPGSQEVAQEITRNM